MTTVHKMIKDISPMTQERARELEAISDEDIDFTDIPPLDEEFFKSAKLAERDRNHAVRKAQSSKTSISIRIDTEVLEWLKSQAQGQKYETMINDILRNYVQHNS